MSAEAEKSVRTGRRQRGAAMMIFMILLTMAALAYLLSSLSPGLTEARRERQTQEVLAQARDALIGYALRYREDQIADGQYDRVYGYLPLPDLGTSRNNNSPACTQEGCDAANFSGNGLNKTVIGRLPWRTLGIQPLRDGNGECLWYMVSGSHQRIQRVTPMNWDTLGQIDVVATNDTDKLKSLMATDHDRPIAIIFSAGPPVGNQNRGQIGSDVVTECGGNYTPENYLDPSLAAALLKNDGVTPAPDIYFSGGNSVDTSSNNLAISTQGKVFKEGSNLRGACSQNNSNCALIGNDAGLTLTPDTLFGTIRKNASFRTDINSMFDRITDCLRDSTPSGSYAKIAGADNDPCYGTNLPPRGYYPSYKEMLWIAGVTSQVNGNNCAGALLFASQRNTTWEFAGEPSGNTPKCPKTNPLNPYQCRITASDKSDQANYLESINLTSFPGGTLFSGPEMLERASPTQTPWQDIVRCIPTTRSFVTTQSPGLAAASLPQMAGYDPGTRTITLGQTVVGSPLASSVSNFLYGCAWRPETHTLGSGLRSYFTFRINDVGGATWPTLGFTYTLADGDNNGIDACGAAGQHLGFSGNNTESPFIASPKIAFEIDPRREGAFTPMSSVSSLTNGRNDPPTDAANYRGGHVALVYWGGETPIETYKPPQLPLPAPPYCIPPASYSSSDSKCYLPQEEDDNVHGQTAFFRTVAGVPFPPPPTNPAAPIPRRNIPPDSPAGVYKLDPVTASVPVNQDFHVRLELTRTRHVRIDTAANLDLNAPGNPVNGMTLAAGDRVWVRYQTEPAENGLYVWNGAAIPMTRVADGEPAANSNLPRVRVATTDPISIILPGDDTIDGVYLFPGDRVLVKDQLAPAQNGVYVWQDAGHPLVRADDAGSPAELAGMLVEVQQGQKNARSIWRQNVTSLVVGTTALSWTNYRVKLVAPATTNPASPGAELDGIKMKLGDRVFVKNDRVYLWRGATTPMVPADDVVAGSSIVQIQQGAEANALWLINGPASKLLTVRVATQASVNLAAPGASIDGVPLAAGDRVLVRYQGDASQNGIYVVSGGALVRAADAGTAPALAGAATLVLAGSDVGRVFRQTTLAANGTLDTDSVQWSAIDRSTSYLLEAWILLDNRTYTNQMAAMKDTTRPMRLLSPGFTPQLQDRPVIPYPFRNARPGFTIGQRTSINDQTVSIRNYFTTWFE